MDVIQSTILQKIAGLRHGFFCPGSAGGRQDNLSYKNGTPDEVRSARKRACSLIRIQSEFLTHVYQDHGVTVWDVSLSQRGAGALTGEDPVGVGDALMTTEAEMPLAIQIADCLPVFFSTPDARAVGLAHAGWRGTLENLSGVMVERFRRGYGIEPSDLVVWIGPGISKDCFEVGQEVLAPFQERWGHVDGCVDLDRRRIDLKALNAHQLLAAGVSEDRIEISPFCTFADRRFFSYRRDGAGIGHNMAVIQRG